VAGSFDEGQGSNVALFTIGGLGDNTNNPVPTSTDPAKDDELYNLLPFIKNGDSSVTLNTVNPSNDDNIFFAHLTLEGVKAVDSSNVVTLAVSPATVTEDGAGNLVYTFTRTGVLTNPLVVGYTVGGSATLTADYTQTGATTFSATNGTVTFAAGASTATVIVDPQADAVPDPDETVDLTLTLGTGYAIGTSNAVSGKILAPILGSPHEILGTPNNDLLQGFAGNDTLTDNLDDDEFYGGAGNDSITSGDGQDYVEGGTGNDIIFSGNDNDELYGEDGNDIINAGAGDDWLEGGNGNDTLVGGAGEDTLIGSLGIDSLSGDAGADQFVLNKNSGADIITDFASGIDKLQVSASEFGGGLIPVPLSVSQLLSGSSVNANSASGQRFLYNTGSGALSFDSDGLAGGGILIANLTNLPPISNSDFLVVD
jgi:Ca2+-binding RTX toxin-like protein